MKFFFLQFRSYFGPFGIDYMFGRVPIGGTDFSPRFYTYMDHKDESMNTFMLTEQDFKYKVFNDINPDDNFQLKVSLFIDTNYFGSY